MLLLELKTSLSSLLWSQQDSLFRPDDLKMNIDICKVKNFPNIFFNYDIVKLVINVKYWGPLVVVSVNCGSSLTTPSSSFVSISSSSLMSSTIFLMATVLAFTLEAYVVFSWILSFCCSFRCYWRMLLTFSSIIMKLFVFIRSW